MGQQVEANIAAWRKAAGIEGPTDDSWQKLSEIEKLTFDLMKLIVLEMSGIRDGDGHWYGSDPLDGTIRQIYEVWEGKRPPTKMATTTDELPF